MAIDYLNPSRSGDLDYQRSQRTAALDRELQYDMPQYNGNLAKMQARGLKYGRDRNAMNSELDSEVLSGAVDPLFQINRERAQTIRDTRPTSAMPDFLGGDESGGGFQPKLIRQPRALPQEALAFANKSARAANARSYDQGAMSAQDGDYLAPTAPQRTLRSAPVDAGPTDEDRAAMQERWYQSQLAQNDPLALARKGAIDQQKVQDRIRSEYLASPQGMANARRDRQNAGEFGPTASTANDNPYFGGQRVMSDPDEEFQNFRRQQVAVRRNLSPAGKAGAYSY